MGEGCDLKGLENVFLRCVRWRHLLLLKDRPSHVKEAVRHDGHSKQMGNTVSGALLRWSCTKYTDGAAEELETGDMGVLLAWVKIYGLHCKGFSGACSCFRLWSLGWVGGKDGSLQCIGAWETQGLWLMVLPSQFYFCYGSIPSNMNGIINVTDWFNPHVSMEILDSIKLIQMKSQSD